MLTCAIQIYTHRALGIFHRTHGSLSKFIWLCGPPLLSALNNVWHRICSVYKWSLHVPNTNGCTHIFIDRLYAYIFDTLFTMLIDPNKWVVLALYNHRRCVNSMLEKVSSFGSWNVAVLFLLMVNKSLSLFLNLGSGFSSNIELWIPDQDFALLLVYRRYSPLATRWHYNQAAKRRKASQQWSYCVLDFPIWTPCGAPGQTPVPASKQ